MYTDNKFSYMFFNQNLYFEYSLLKIVDFI